ICDGRSWQLADTYLHTLVHKKLFDVLDRKGVIGGNGAGAAMMASRLFGEPEKYGWHTGFGLIRNTMVVSSNPNAKTLATAKNILEENAGLQGILLAEDSKVVIQKKRLTVEGGNKNVSIKN